MNIFKVKREELPLLLLASVLFLLLNALMVQYQYGLFTRGGNLGFWGLFIDHFTVSGFDDLSYVTLSRWKVYFSLYRHPLLPLFYYPFAMLNQWIMAEWGVNATIYIVACFNLIADIYSFLFLYRIFHEVIGLAKSDSMVLTMLYFSFASIIMTSFVPDHFVFSQFFLMLLMYVVGKQMRENRMIGTWQTAVLMFLSSGVTLTNSAMVGLAAWVSRGKKVFRPAFLAVGIALPMALLFGVYELEYNYLVVPDAKVQAENRAKKLKADKKYAAQYEKRHRFLNSRVGEQVSDNPYFEWTDLSANRLDAVIENFFGESIQVHQHHALEDVNKSRPVIVRYSHAFNYVVEALIVLLFVVGIGCGCRNRFFWVPLSWFLLSMVLHIVLGFGIIEVYIMGAHWLFVIPIAMAFLMKSLTKRYGMILRYMLFALTIYLWSYNLTYIIPYMLSGSFSAL